VSRLRDNAQYARIMLGESGEVRRIASRADVKETEPGVWRVGSIDSSGDGGIYETFFEGPDSYRRAVEYAAAKYSGTLVISAAEPPQHPTREAR
jgi:hypothetical protein